MSAFDLWQYAADKNLAVTSTGVVTTGVRWSPAVDRVIAPAVLPDRRETAPTRPAVLYPRSPSNARGGRQGPTKEQQ